MAVLRLSPQALRDILQLPDCCEVVRVETVQGVRGLVHVVVEGAGEDVEEGYPLPPAQTGIISIDRNDAGGITRLTVDWGFSRVASKLGEEVEIP